MIELTPQHLKQLFIRTCLLSLTLAVVSSCLKIERAPIMVELDARIDAMPPPTQPFFDGLVYKETLFDEVKLDLYLPYNYQADSSLRHPVYLYVHGGSWLFGHRKQVRLGEQLIEKLRHAGSAVISIDYRKLHEAGFHRMVDDAVASLDWLAENAEQYHLDPKNLVLHGASAGGHLVQMMASLCRDLREGAWLVVSDFGPSDLITLRKRATGKRGNFLRIWPEFRLKPVSPIEHVRPGLPPLFLTHGELDEVVPVEQSNILLQALEDTGNRVELLVIKGSNHGLLDMAPSDKAELVEDKIRRILEAQGLPAKLDAA